MSRVRVWITALCCAALAIVLVGNPRAREGLHRVAYALHLRRPVPVARPGMSFPALGLQQAAGAPLDRLALRRGTVLYNVFASWCVPCRDEAPLLARAARSGTVIVGIDRGEPASSVTHFVDDFGISYPVLLDPDSVTDARLSARVIPETIVVRDGIIREIAVGPIDERFLDGVTNVR